VSLAVWDHSVTCQPTQVNAARLHPSQTGWYSIYRPFKAQGAKSNWLTVAVATRQPGPARPEHTI